MSVTYRVRDWSANFEKASTRRLDKLNWISVPVKHDGLSYKTLMSRDDGPIVFAAWVLILQVAAKCPERGTLANDRGPLGASHLSMMTGAPVHIFEAALQTLCLPEIAWVEASGGEVPRIVDAHPVHSGCTPDAHPMHTGCAPQDRQDSTEQDITNRTEEGASGDASPLSSRESEVVDAWNSIPGVTHAVALSAKRRKALKARLSDPLFRDRWRDAIEKIRGSAFCAGSNERNWRASLDWFLQPDTVAKAIEGQYDARRKNGSSNGATALVNDYLDKFGGRE